MSDAYDRQLRALAKTVAKELGFESFLREGVYCSGVGPNYETVTECRFLRSVGVDSVGEWWGWGVVWGKGGGSGGGGGWSLVGVDSVGEWWGWGWWRGRGAG